MFKMCQIRAFILILAAPSGGWAGSIRWGDSTWSIGRRWRKQRAGSVRHCWILRRIPWRKKIKNIDRHLENFKTYLNHSYCNRLATFITWAWFGNNTQTFSFLLNKTFDTLIPPTLFSRLSCSGTRFGENFATWATFY